MHRVSRKLVTLGGLLGLLSTGLVTGAVAPAGATHTVASPSTPISGPACSQNITASGNYHLTSDIGPCPGQDGTGDWGIKITASNVVLDLNHKHIKGCTEPTAVTGCNAPQPANAAGEGPDGGFTLGEGAGVIVDNVTGVTVKNGTIRNMDQGIVLQGGGSHTVTDMVIKDNITTVLTAAPPVGEGMELFDSDNNVIKRSQFIHNGPYAGILLHSGSSNNIIGSDIDASNNCVAGGDGNTFLNNNTMTNGTTFQTSGIRLENHSNDNDVGCNTVKNSSLEGVTIFYQAVRNKVVGNFILANGYHYGTGGTSHATAPAPGDGDRVLHGDGTGPWVRSYAPPSRMGDGIRVHGIANTGGPTPPPSPNTVVKANWTCANAGNGIRVDSQNNSITGNKSGSGHNMPGFRTVPIVVNAATGGTYVQTGESDSCRKNNVAKDPRPADPRPAGLPNYSFSNNFGMMAYDLHDSNGPIPTGAAANPTATPCDNNIWSGNAWGANSWPAVLASVDPRYDDRGYAPGSPASTVGPPPLSCTMQ